MKLSVAADRPGIIAEVTTLADRLGMQRIDIRIVHATDGSTAAIEMVIGASEADAFERGLHELGYVVTKR